MRTPERVVAWLVGGCTLLPPSCGRIPRCPPGPSPAPEGRRGSTLWDQRMGNEGPAAGGSPGVTAGRQPTRSFLNQWPSSGQSRPFDFPVGLHEKAAGQSGHLIFLPSPQFSDCCPNWASAILLPEKKKKVMNVLWLVCECIIMPRSSAPFVTKAHLFAGSFWHPSGLMS